MKRPLVWVAVAMAVGAYSAAFGWTGGVAVPLMVCGAGAAAWVMVRPRAVAQRLGVALMFAGMGGLLWEAHHAGERGDAVSRWAAEHRNAYVELTGTVRRADLIVPGREYASFELDVDSLRQGNTLLELTGRTHVRWYAPGEPLGHGDRVRLRGELFSELGHVNPGVQGIEDYLRLRGVHTALSMRGGRAVDVLSRAPCWHPMAMASRLRHAEAERLRPAIPEAIRPFVLAVWLGDRRDMADWETQAYVISGTAHILSVSGVHMAILYVSLAFFLKMLWPDRVRLRAVLTLGVVFAYAVLTGARVSSMRAACMIALYLLADVLDREPDAPTALGLAGIIFTTLSPDALLDTGFLLSFSSVASLLLFQEPIGAWLIRVTSPDPNRQLAQSRMTWRERVAAYIDNRRGMLGEVLMAARRMLWGVRGGIATALAVQIVPLPLAIHFFHVVPLAGPLVNLFVVPLVGVVLWMSLLTTIAAFLVPPVALLFGHAMVLPVVLTQQLALAATWSGAYATMTSPAPTAFLLYWLLAALLWAALHGKLAAPHQRWATAGCCAVCVALWSPVRPPGEVVFLDVGHGDATFVRTPDGTTVLVDAGDRSEFMDCGERIVAPFLWANHVRSLDYLILTHADRDHMGGAPYLLEHFDVGTLLVSTVTSDRALEREVRELCTARGIPVRQLAPGDRIVAGDASLTVLHPPPGWPAEPVNETSLVLKLAWPGMDVLLAGDVEEDGERALLGSTVRSTVLKSPHHGSNTSSTPAFVDAVDPELVVISGSDRRSRGMHAAVLERYRARGITVLRTDIHGAVRLRVGRDGMAAETERGRRGYLMQSSSR